MSSTTSLPHTAAGRSGGGAGWRLTLESLRGLVYEEEDPDQIFEGFGLSEGLAAETLPQD